MLKLFRKIFSSSEKDIPFSERQTVVVNHPVAVKNDIITDPIAESERLKKLGNDFLKQNNLQQAEHFYKEALKVRPDYVDAYMNLGWIYKEQKKFKDAETNLLKVIELNEKNHEAYYILGGIHEFNGQPHKAIELYKKVMELNPDFMFVYTDLARAYFQTKQHALTQEVLEKGLALYQDNQNEFNFQLSEFFLSTGHYKKAVETYKKILNNDLHNSDIYNNIAMSLKAWGKVQEAMHYYQKGYQTKDLTVYQKLHFLTSIIFNEYYLKDDLLDSSYQLATSYDKYLSSLVKPYTHYVKRGKKLRVGFVSGDFKAHPVAMFIEGTLQHLDRKKFELIAYSTTPLEDPITSRLKSYFNEWHVIQPIGSHDKIYKDNIDILVDLAGHTLDSGLGNFAAKPSPVQVAWIGYFGTTGLKSMDYLLADKGSVEPGEEVYFSEKIKYLSQTRLNFTPHVSDNNLPIDAPGLKNGFITFGCYQNIAKITSEMIATWKEILDKVPNSKIRFQISSNADINELLHEKLAKGGIDSNRFILAPAIANREDYMRSYGEVDIILDTFPYNGGTTTCEALYMGVPTITLRGHNIVSRQSATMMTCVGLEDWIASSLEQYIDKAVKFSNDLEWLNGIRHSLRERFKSSHLGDSASFTKELEGLLIQMYEEKMGKINL